MPAHAIAIVGLAGRFPGAGSLDDFWRMLAEGTEVLEELSLEDLDAAGTPEAVRRHPRFVRRGTFLKGAEDFDASFFGYAPREAQVLDPQQRVFLECAWEALEHAGYGAGSQGVPESVGVYAGAGMNTYLYTNILRNPALAEAVGGYQLMLASDKDYLCTRVSYKLGLKGPSLSVQTACSTSLVAVQVACRALQTGECDMALAGGVSIPFPQRSGYVYQDGMIMSPDGRCRPFDARAQGTRAGAGAGVVVLKRLDQALADGDTVHAVIRGIAINNDGADKAGYTAPSIEGQLEVIATAQALAGVEAATVSFMETHGTATPLGDPIEMAALKQAFAGGTAGHCVLGALKANIGHLDAAAGVAGLIKATLALSHRQWPPLVNFERAHPALGLEHSPFRVLTQCQPWQTPQGMPRRAGVSSFGIGGTNAHAVLEEAPPRPERPDPPGPQLLVWSARSPEALERLGQHLAAHLAAHPEQALADVAYTLQVGRRAFGHRRVLVARDGEHAARALADTRHAGVLGGVHEGGARPVVFLFSGQGSQHTGMGHGLYLREAVYRSTVDRCAQILQPLLGCDVRELMFAASQSAQLTRTGFAQAALFVTEVALAALWRAHGVTPAAMLGHSLGELVAAHLAGVMSLADALEMVAARGRLMQARPPGRMAAVSLDAVEVAKWLGDGVELAAVNGPGLCTIAGPSTAVDALVARLERAGIQARPLQTSHAFHSAMMEPAQEPFRAVVGRLRLSPPAVPFLSNVTGTWITDAQATSPAYWAEHLRRPVHFEAGLRRLVERLPNAFLLEVGPGQALAGIARACLMDQASRTMPPLAASLPRANDAGDAVETWLETLGRLWLAGAGIRWPGDTEAADATTGDAPAHPKARRRVALPTYPFERRRYTVAAAAPSPQGSHQQAIPGPAAAAAATQADPPEHSAPARSARVDDWFSAPTWARDDSVPAPWPPAGPGEGPGRWLVLGDTSPLTDAVANALAARGLHVLRADASPGCKGLESAGPDRWRLRRGDAEDLQRLLPEAAGTAPLAGIVHLWALLAVPRAAKVSWPLASGEAAYDGLVALACALPDPDDTRPLQILHATIGAESVLGEPVEDPTQAIAIGPTLVLPAEIPGLRMRTVDVSATMPGRAGWAAVASALADEAQLAGIEPRVAYRAGLRWVRRYERLSLPSCAGTAGGQAEALPLREQGCYLITGGLGGMGLALARWLGTTWRARLVLTTRRALPPREQWAAVLAASADDHATAGLRQVLETVQAIEAAGGEVLPARADTADESQMLAALDLARARFGELHGVFHAAGLPGRGVVARRSTSEDARAAMAPKVGGLHVLCRLLHQTPLDLVVLMSSINAVIPTPGACDYAAANAVLDAFVDSAARPAAWRQVVAIDWGAWREVGMAARLQVPEALRASWDTHLAGAIAPPAGLEALGRVLASRRRCVIVETYDVLRMHELMRRRATEHAAARQAEPDAPAAAPARQADAEPAPAAGSRPALSTPFEAPANEAEQRIAAIWEQVLGVSGVGVNDDFFELGGHSLMFTRVLALIDEGFRTKLPLRDVFDATTVRMLARKVPDGAVGAAGPNGPAGGKGPAGPASDGHAREVLEL